MEPSEQYRGTYKSYWVNLKSKEELKLASPYHSWDQFQERSERPVNQISVKKRRSSRLHPVFVQSAYR